MNSGTIPTSIGAVDVTRLVDELTYSNFAHNRDLGMSAEAYASMFRDFPLAAYENRYQNELLDAALSGDFGGEDAEAA